MLDSLWEAECRVHGQSAGIPGTGGTGNGGHAGGRSWGCRRPGLLWRRAGICFPPGAGSSGASPMARRVPQPGAGHTGACRHGPSSSGPGASHIPGRRRTDHANGSGVDHLPGGIRPPGIPGYVRRDWAGHQGPGKFPQHAQDMAGRDSDLRRARAAKAE